MPIYERLINIPADEMPRRWYNIDADMPWPVPPPKDAPDTKIKIKDLPKVLLKRCLEHEESKERWIRIPDDVIDLYLLVGRPRPLHRAYNLERRLKTPARIYFKREDLAPTGSHKMNHALPQVYFAKEEGVGRLVTETGAGQWGTAMAYACALLGMPITIYWVRSAYKLKRDRYSFMKMCGADVVPSPSDRTEIGKKFLKENPEHPGNLAIALAEAAEDAFVHEDTKYPIGSVEKHVLIYATINGLETMKQFELIDEDPDLMIGCYGGGSNFAGFVFPFVGEVLQKKRECEFLAVQCTPGSLVKGEYRYDYVDSGKMFPMAKTLTLGIDVFPPPRIAEGLRYAAGGSPQVCLLVHKGVIKATYYDDEKPIAEAAKLVLETEGFLPAPESAYAVKAGIDEALKCKKTGEEKVIAINISGHGYLDFPGYRKLLPEL